MLRWAMKEGKILNSMSMEDIGRERGASLSLMDILLSSESLGAMMALFLKLADIE